MGLSGADPSIEGQLQQRVLHDFGERRVDPVLTAGEVGHPLAVRDGLDQRRDQQCRLVAKDVSAE
jgi:hypothetical protein